LQELEWHLFSAMFLLSIAYGMQDDTHVRVDVFYLNFSPKTQALINIIGRLSVRLFIHCSSGYQFCCLLSFIIDAEFKTMAFS
jgi:TRAP-type mannitol/chloroaromatic compound transport system permease small subunit